jgi:hypothetical protein
VLTLALVLLSLAGGLAALVRYCIVFPRQPFRGPRPPLDAGEKATAARLSTHLRAVASEPHNVVYPQALERAAQYIEQELRAIGLAPVAHVFEADGIAVRNIEVVLEPQGADADTPCVVIGAHYDAPDDCPGANDNGSGVAALIELARMLSERGLPLQRRLRLAFFVNEEQPYGKTELMGSWRYARALAERSEKVTGMIALETLGYFSDAPGSQRFPPPFGLIYPDTGNFVAFVALPGGRAFLRAAIGAFRRQASFPSIGGLAPGFIEGIDLSDHWAFHQFDFPALMVTDTAPFRNPHYHELTDTPETVDVESLARITHALAGMAGELAGGRA